jgi:hypothetical protein
MERVIKMNKPSKGGIELHTARSTWRIPFLRRALEVRSSHGWHFAKDVPNDDLIGGNCEQNASLC